MHIFITIVDYGMGNVGSIKSALDFLKINSVISNKKADLSRASHLILPGVGAFGEGIKNIRKNKLLEMLNQEVIQNKKPFLGVCLGMQLLAEYGEEDGHYAGLGWIKGKTIKLKTPKAKKLLLPHVGWNDVTVASNNPLFRGIDTLIFYFVHSYHFKVEENSVVIGKCNYGENFVAAVHKDNIFGVQFHPEKSQKSGLDVLRNFINFSQ